MRALRCWAGASLVLVAFSERVFWSFWRPDDRPLDLLVTLFAYSLIAAWALSWMRIAHVRSHDALFLVGALVGWMAEGVVVNTAYGMDSNPFPFSISFTGLSWHALISVVVGWHAVPKLLAEGRLRSVVGWMSVLGLCWGTWAGYYLIEPNGVDPSLPQFASHSVFVVAMLTVGWALLQGSWQEHLRWDRWLFGGVSVCALLMFLLGWLPVQPLEAVVLALLFGGVLLVVKHNPKG